MQDIGHSATIINPRFEHYWVIWQYQMQQIKNKVIDVVLKFQREQRFYLCYDNCADDPRSRLKILHKILNRLLPEVFNG